MARIDFPVVAARISELPSSIDEVFLAVPEDNVCMPLPCNVRLPVTNVELARTESSNLLVEAVSALLGVGGP